MKERTVAMAIHGRNFVWMSMSPDDVISVLDTAHEYRQETGEEPVEVDLTIITKDGSQDVSFSDILVEVEHEGLVKKLNEARN